MPPGSVLKHVHMLKASGSGFGSSTYAVQNAAASISYAALGSATVSAGFSLDVDNIYKPIPINDRILKFTDTSSNNPGTVPPGPTDFLLVEYY